MKIKVLLLIFGTSLHAWAQYNPPSNAEALRNIPNGEFFSNTSIWKSYVIANLDYFNKLSNPSHIPCGDKDKPNLVKALSQSKLGNIKFLQMKNTDIFYSTGDRFQCDMSVSILKHEFPRERRSQLVNEGVEQKDAFYWTNSILAKRWYIAAQSLKKCGIRIKDYSMTTFESTGVEAFKVPTIHMGSPAIYYLMSSFAKDEEQQNKLSVKFAYTGEIKESNDQNIARGDDQYSTAYSAFLNEGRPAMRSGWIKRDSFAVPIFPPGVDSDDTGYVDELHELYHILTQKGNAESHINPKDNPDTYGPMTVLYMRSGGKFSNDECKNMRKLGEKSKLLTCYPERPFQPSPDKE